MRHRCTALAASLTLTLGAGCGDLDRIDRVHDLRLLGIWAEPPDQALRIGPSLGVLGTPQPVQLTALVADPNGGGRPIQYSLSVCAGLDNGRMTPSPSAGTTFGGAATAQVTLMPVIISAPLDSVPPMLAPMQARHGGVPELSG